MRLFILSVLMLFTVNTLDAGDYQQLPSQRTSSLSSKAAHMPAQQGRSEVQGQPVAPATSPTAAVLAISAPTIPIYGSVGHVESAPPSSLRDSPPPLTGWANDDAPKPETKYHYCCGNKVATTEQIGRCCCGCICGAGIFTFLILYATGVWAQWINH